MADKDKDKNMEKGEAAPDITGTLLAALLPSLQKQLEGALSGLLTGLLAKLPALLGGLLGKKGDRPPIAHPTLPHPVDDDLILPPTVVQDKVTITRVDTRLLMAQYSAKLFPDQYTEDNPQGLYKDLDQYVGGGSALNRESKVWIDHRAYYKDPQTGQEKELTGEQIRKFGLAYRTSHIARDVDRDLITQIVGKGAGVDGKPAPGYLMEENTFMGLGITAWENSLGFNCQMKAFGEGTVEFSGHVDGVHSSPFRLRFS